MTVAKVKTSEGWSDLHVVGPPGPQGPAGSPLAMIESTTPPPTPAVGDLWLYHPATGITWLFRYEPDQDATYPWQFIGGSPLYVSVEVNEYTQGFGVWFKLASGPTVQLARKGVYSIRTQCWFSNTYADWAAGHMGPSGTAGGSPDAFDHGKILAHYSAGGSAVSSHERQRTVVAGELIESWYHTSNVNANPGFTNSHCTYNLRRMWVLPVRIG